MGLIKKFRIKSYKGDETIIELKNVSVFYNKRQILNNLNLKINKQEILGMLGPNGVGKSTIFNLITGLKDPNHGEIIINGINCTNFPINERFTKFKIGLTSNLLRLQWEIIKKSKFKNSLPRHSLRGRQSLFSACACA